MSDADRLKSALESEVRLDPALPTMERAQQVLTLAVIVDAARKWANMTSPETIEKAAKAAQQAQHEFWCACADVEQCENLEHSLLLDEFVGMAQAVLRAVEEET